MIYTCNAAQIHLPCICDTRKTCRLTSMIMIYCNEKKIFLVSEIEITESARNLWHKNIWKNIWNETPIFHLPNRTLFIWENQQQFHMPKLIRAFPENKTFDFATDAADSYPSGRLPWRILYSPAENTFSNEPSAREYKIWYKLAAARWLWHATSWLRNALSCWCLRPNCAAVFGQILVFMEHIHIWLMCRKQQGAGVVCIFTWTGDWKEKILKRAICLEKWPWRPLREIYLMPLFNFIHDQLLWYMSTFRILIDAE